TKALWLDRGRMAAFGSPRAVVQSYLRKDQQFELGVELIPPQSPKLEPNRDSEAITDSEAKGAPTKESAEDLKEESKQPADLSPSVDGHVDHEASAESVELPWGEVNYEPHAATHGVRVRRAYIAVDGEDGVSKVPYDKDYQLVIHYEIPEKIVGLRIGYKFYNERDQVILHTVTNDPVDDPQNVGEPGLRATTVHIPGALFAPGTFDVEIGVWSPLIGHHMSENAYRFEIVNPTVDSIGMEVLRPIFRWEVQ
ncbi:MAG: hypothetical protein P1V97_39055, partial [Planctomycetota bacterium]|nr:hypothetical protein [Planctomycetota bacterium]